MRVRARHLGMDQRRAPRPLGGNTALLPCKRKYSFRSDRSHRIPQRAARENPAPAFEMLPPACLHFDRHGNGISVCHSTRYNSGSFLFAQATFNDSQNSPFSLSGTVSARHVDNFVTLVIDVFPERRFSSACARSVGPPFVIKRGLSRRLPPLDTNCVPGARRLAYDVQLGLAPMAKASAARPELGSSFAPTAAKKRFSSGVTPSSGQKPRGRGNTGKPSQPPAAKTVHCPRKPLRAPRWRIWK